MLEKLHRLKIETVVNEVSRQNRIPPGLTLFRRSHCRYGTNIPGDQRIALSNLVCNVRKNTIVDQHPWRELIQYGADVTDRFTHMHRCWNRAQFNRRKQRYRMLHRRHRHQRHAVALAHSQLMVKRSAALYLIQQLRIGVTEHLVHYRLALRRPGRRAMQHIADSNIPCWHFSPPPASQFILVIRSL